VPEWGKPPVMNPFNPELVKVKANVRSCVSQIPPAAWLTWGLVALLLEERLGKSPSLSHPLE